MGDGVAVFDAGKTNVKLIVFDRDGKVVAERSQLNGPLPPDARWPYLRLDAERAWSFLIAALKDVGASIPIEAVSISAHGAAGVLVNENGVAAPPVDYEFDGFAEVDADYDALRPPFEECLSPLLPRGLNLGRQIFYLERTFPEAFAAARRFSAIRNIGRGGSRASWRPRRPRSAPTRTSGGRTRGGCRASSSGRAGRPSFRRGATRGTRSER